jgi:hypothetical protein
MKEKERHEEISEREIKRQKYNNRDVEKRERESRRKYNKKNKTKILAIKLKNK